MRTIRIIENVTVAASIAIASGCSPSAQSADDVRTANRVRAVQELSDAAQVVADMRQIPTRQRTRARCVLVVPSLVRAGLLVGGRHGDGVVSCRNGATWSAPLFVTASGGSVGLQVGVESSDVIMLVMGEPGMNKLLRPSLEIGADISAAAGPLGKAAEAGTDPTITSEILSYARSRGLFAGAEVSGSSLHQDSTANASMYGATDVHTILTSGVRAPKEAASFLNNITSAFPPRDAALEAALKRGASL